MKHKKSALAGFVALCLIGSTAWYTSVSGTIAETEDRVVPAVRPIPTQRVTLVPGQTYRSFPGTVRATERVDMAFSVDGLLRELNGTEGSAVQKGEVIARLDSRDAGNSYQVAKARYEVAKKDFERSQILMDRKVIPPADHDAAKSAYDVSAAEMRIRKKALDDTILTAPFDGIVSRRYVENFQHIKAKDNILSLQNISRIDVVIQVPERLIAHGGGNRFGEVRVRFDAAPLAWYDALIKEFSIESDPVTRTYDVVVSLAPPTGVEILPGMTATVRAPTGSGSDLADGDKRPALVPLAAVVGDSDSSAYVWVIPEQGGNPVKTAVEIGEIRKGGIEITGGLEVGELVAIAGVHSLRDEMQVRPARTDREGLDQ